MTTAPLELNHHLGDRTRNGHRLSSPLEKRWDLFHQTFLSTPGGKEMKRVLIIYGSTTGNTEYVAHHIGDYLAAKGVNVESRDVAQTQISDVVSAENPIILGCSTWGEDEIGLQEDFDLFHAKLADTDLSGKIVALFGCGDSSYTHFCGAVDKIGQTIKKNGAHLLGSPLKIDGEPDEAHDQINGWLDELVTRL